FDWPVSGTVISEFGAEGGTSQDGIDIKAQKGSPVKASEKGEVVHVTDDMRVFGNVIILKHKGDFYTLYAHNDKNLVKNGDKVIKGEKIAMVGSSGDAEGAKLHFELRDGRDVRDPILFLP
ncbi:MAG: M23 family metallopeptidase, partial [Proteobacteria bacterium]|nr:M23 family metallopeptidase [Pseudomonadota bacterium]